MIFISNHAGRKETFDSELMRFIHFQCRYSIRKICDAVGCLECRETGFKGREGIYEVMPFSEPLQKYLDNKGDLPTLRKQAYKEGMLSLRLSGAQKVAAGLTTVKEILRVTPDTQIPT